MWGGDVALINSFIKESYLLCVLVIGCLVVAMNLSACRNSPTLEPNHRPAGVPNDAMWVGGADGGAYVRCGIDTTRNVNPCSVWSDYTGQLVESGDYELVKKHRAATEAELHVTFPDFGGRIYLQGGLVLKRR